MAELPNFAAEHGVGECSTMYTDGRSCDPSRRPVPVIHTTQCRGRDYRGGGICDRDQCESVICTGDLCCVPLPGDGAGFPHT